MERNLTQKMMMRLAGGLLVILILTTPVLYFLTTRFYAEDLIRIVQSYGINPHIDLGEDVMMGVLIQFFVILTAILAVILFIMRVIPHRLWRPFNDTLRRIREFRVEKGAVRLPQNTGIREFSILNETLNNIMEASVRSYKIQKEFTENASHELQTPLAIVLNKIDNLLQDKHLTEYQAREMQEMYQELRHMSNLSRSLLMLSKIENGQFHTESSVDLCGKIDDILVRLEAIAGDITINTHYAQPHIKIVCNETLLESMITNLVVNAVRHNRKDGSITITVTGKELTVANTSDERPLDATVVFSRFYRVKENQKGNGLGLAIVKSICDYHHWTVAYHYENHQHCFTITF